MYFAESASLLAEEVAHINTHTHTHIHTHTHTYTHTLIHRKRGRENIQIFIIKLGTF